MSELAQQHMDADTARAARLFVSSLTGRFCVRTAILFGSRARGGFRPDSDADIAVLLEEPHGPFLLTKLEWQKMMPQWADDPDKSKAEAEVIPLRGVA